MAWHRSEALTALGRVDEARLAEVELLLCRGASEGPERLRRARTIALGGGHEASSAELDDLVGAHGVP